ncbi:SusC/RagA family protein [Sphingobacterium sp. KB22]|uniref:SusC/RagA family protein n=2 Tax=Sphingobacterium hungaricum TaxID=2082723 RepID=A0A928UXA7_9SPHI|nr:SusC/RagA family protein [Sphingobacterium hungaricum]
MQFKSFKMIRLIGLFMLVFQISLAAEGQGIVSLRKQKIKASDLIREIKKQTGYSVLYSSQTLDDNKYIQVDFQNSSLENVIKTLVQGQNVNYEIKDRTILISPGSNNVRNADVIKPEANVRQSSIRGVVRDENGQALQGASVSVQGANNATSTDASGEFTLPNVKVGDVLVVRYVGYQAKNVSLTSLGSQLTVQLAIDNNTIDDVVVTALGIRRSERALSYNVQQVDGEEMTKVQDANFINALSGRVAGVNINASSGGVGGASKVVLRGTKSISKSSNVLYVIDGIPMFNRKGAEGQEFASTGSSEGIADFNPEDIESMSVLTGAAAAALYGSEASNGAIVITTKKGVIGKTTLTLSQNTQFLSAFQLPKFQNRYGTGSSLASGVNDKSWGLLLNEANTMGYNPADDYFKTGVISTEALTFSTGNERNQTYASAGAVNSTGIVPNNKYDRYNFTLRNTSKFLDDKLSLDVGFSYILQNDQNMINQGVYGNPIVTAYLFPRGDDWNDIKMYERYDVTRKIDTQYWPQGINEFVGQNPYWINYRNLRNNKKDRYMFNANLNYQLNDWLSFTARGRMDNSNNVFTEKLYATTNTTITDGSINGFYGITNDNMKQYYGDFIANVNKQFNDFSLQANVGAIINRTDGTFLPIRGPILPNAIPNKFGINQIDFSKKSPSYEDKIREQQSIFATAELGYKNTYYLTLTGRNDWDSALYGPYSEQGSFFYPSVGLSVVLSEALNLPTSIEYLKVRSSFASVATPYDPYLATLTYPWDYTLQQYMDQTLYPIGQLFPERTDSWEVGLNTRFLQGFNLDLSFYHAMTMNQTFDPQISASAGYSGFRVQTGKVLNKGVELALGYTKTWNDFNWSSNYTFSANKNEIKELVSDWTIPETGEVIDINRLDVGGLGRAKFILKPGGSLGDIYSLSDLQRDSNGDVYIDQNGGISVNNNVGDIFLGSVFPKSNMAWRNDFGYKNFNLGFMFAARFGGVVYSATQAAMDAYGVSEASAIARDNGGVTVNGSNVINPEIYYATVGGTSGIPQFYTYSATNVRLQEASIGYTFPKSMLGNVGDLSISLIGRNLWMIYNKAPFDPEATATTGNYYQGINNFMTPNTRNLGFNVRLKF